MSNSNMLFTAVSATISVATANANLNGTGTIGTLVTGAQAGTIISSIVIKATTTNAQGMVRLFLNNGSSWFLLQEVMIPATVPTGVVPSFSATLSTPINLAPGYALGVSTQNAEAFSVTANGKSYLNCACPS